MAKVIFEFTESDAVTNDVPGHATVPVSISVGVEGLNDARPGHAECLALIMKRMAPGIIKALNAVYIRKLEESGVSGVKSEFFKVNLQ
ncbi:hypothetical protein FOT62_22655 [Serratia marcescens]|uniref:Uncharacterized protein n=1 Tax=Serratia marcescens TaxID=615 RepID=A0A5C7BSB4_SERMA|nr:MULTISPECIES: hypothetical protein [Serratia]TXE27123.1 hypothetical protein FOT62_22655 [Serratia marcescens]TXE55320.1 hypothetical protein FOT56_25510 [Serratia marcescens]